MSKKCEGPEWESLLDALDEIFMSHLDGGFDSEDAYASEVNRLIAEAGFSLDEALAIIKREEDDAFDDFCRNAVPIVL